MRVHRSLLICIAATAGLALGAQAATGAGAIVVHRGDTLSAIAARNHVTTADLARANGISNPNFVREGQVLHLPGSSSAPATTSYTAKSGDNLSSIASFFGTSVDAIAAANGISNRNLVRIGQHLTIPARASSGGPAGSANSSGLPSKLAASPSRLALMPTFDKWAAAYHVPADLLKGLCWLESGWQNGVVSSTGAVGIGQLMPDTVALVTKTLLHQDLDPRSSADNIRMSARFLRYLLDRSGGSVKTAVAAYYQGLRSVTERGNYPSTDAYVAGVLALRARF